MESIKIVSNDKCTQLGHSNGRLSIINDDNVLKQRFMFYAKFTVLNSDVHKS